MKTHEQIVQEDKLTENAIRAIDPFDVATYSDNTLQSFFEERGIRLSRKKRLFIQKLIRSAFDRGRHCGIAFEKQQREKE